MSANDFAAHTGKQRRRRLLAIFMVHRSVIAGGMAKLSPHEVRSIAVAAMVDPRSVRKALAGQHLHALTLERIRRALEQMGRANLLPSTPQAA